MSGRVGHSYTRRDVLQATGTILAGGAGLTTLGSGSTRAQTTGTSNAVSVQNGEAEIIPADPESGFQQPYLLYKPETRFNTTRPLYVHPHNRPPVRTRDELITQMEQAAKGPFFVAKQLGLPGLLPGIPRLPDDGPDLMQTLALPTIQADGYLEEIAIDEFPAESLERIDEQLLSMIDDAIERLADADYSVSDQVHMNGFSGSATFSGRFAFLYPERVNAFTAGGSGGHPLPREAIDGTTLRYPLGTADYAAITGRDFDLERWTEISQYLYVGQEDQPLPDTEQVGYYGISHRDQEKAENVYGMNRVTERIPFLEAEYEAVGANATFQIYEGIGHTITNEIIDDVVEVHRKTSAAPHAMFNMTAQRVNTDQLTAGDTVTVVVEIESRVSRTATFPATLTVDGEAVASAGTEVPAGGTDEVTFEYTFADPGTYRVNVNGIQVGDGPFLVTESTPTPTPTPTVTATTTEPVTETPAGTATAAPTDTRGEDGPGFGIGAALSGLTGAAYLLKHCLDDDQ